MNSSTDKPSPPLAPESVCRSKQQRPLVAISACLLGQPVRYDGGHKYQSQIDQHLSPWLDWYPLCPEMDAGLGAPRPPVQLVHSDGQLRALGVGLTDLDITSQLHNSSCELLRQLQQLPNLCGVIVKSRSPSCGLGSTPIHNSARDPTHLGSGLFSQLLAQLAFLPCVEETWLANAKRCERFLKACRLVQERRRLPAWDAEALAVEVGAALHATSGDGEQ